MNQRPAEVRDDSREREARSRHQSVAVSQEGQEMADGGYGMSLRQHVCQRIAGFRPRAFGADGVEVGPLLADLACHGGGLASRWSDVRAWWHLRKCYLYMWTVSGTRGRVWLDIPQ